MLKKIVLWTGFALFVGILVLGAVNRTSDRLARTAEASNEGNAEAAPGGGQAQRGQGQGQGQGQGNGIGRGQGLGQGLAAGQDVAVGHEDCAGKGQDQAGTAGHEDCDGKNGADSRNGASPGGGAGVGVADHVIGDWAAVQGTVAEVDEVQMVVETADGDVVVVEGRPWMFAREQGFVAQVGDQVTVTGFDESGEFKAGTVEDTSNGLTVVLRDETGRPGWAGRGWRAGQAGEGQ